MAQEQQQPPFQPFAPPPQPYQPQQESPLQPSAQFPKPPFFPGAPFEEKLPPPSAKVPGIPFQPPLYGDFSFSNFGGAPFQNKMPDEPLFGDLSSGGVAGFPADTTPDPFAPYGDIKGPPVAGVPLMPDQDSPLSRAPSVGGMPPQMAYAPQGPTSPEMPFEEYPFAGEPQFRDFIPSMPFEEQAEPEMFGEMPPQGPLQTPIAQPPVVKAGVGPGAPPLPPTLPGEGGGGIKRIEGGPPMEPMSPLESEQAAAGRGPGGVLSEIPGAVGTAPTMGAPPGAIPRSPFPMPEEAVPESPLAAAMRDFGMPSEAEPRDMFQPTGEETFLGEPQFGGPQQAPFQPRMQGPFGQQPFAQQPFGQQPFGQPPMSPLAQMAGAEPLAEEAPYGEAPFEGFAPDYFQQAEQASADFINSLSPEDRQALLDADMAGLARGSPLKESPLALNFSGAGFGGTYSLSPQALFTEGTGGADLETGSLYSPLTSPSIERGKELQKQREAFVSSKAGEMPGAADLKKAAEALRDQAEKDIADEKARYLDTLPQRRELSNLLKNNNFPEAFKYAADNGLTDLISNPAELKNLRGPFTKPDLAKFYNSIPSNLQPLFAPSGLQDEKFNFNPQQGFEYSTGQWRGDTGFPLTSAAFSAKPDQTVSKIVNFGIDAMLAAAGVPPLASGLTKAAFTLAETGGDVAAALKSGAGAAIGAKIGEMIRTGIPGAQVPSAAANAAEKAASDAIAQGIAADGLEEVVITALRPSLGSALAGAVASKAVQSALQDAPDFVREGAEPDVEEILVKGSKIKPNLNQGIASLVRGGVQDIFSDRQIAEMQEAEAAETQPEEELEEVKVISERTPEARPVVPVPTGGLESVKPPAQEPLEEVTVTTKRPEPERPPVPVPTGGLDAFEPAPIVDGEQEIKVEGEKPKDRPLLPTPPPEMLDVIQKEILKDYKPTEVKQSKLKTLLDKVGGLKNLLKLLSAIQAASAGRKGAPTGGGLPTGGGGAGGALPKYTFQRTALKPDIDYYTYGTRPEVPFFADTMTGPGSAPDTSILPPKDRPPVFAMGGLAHGGSSEEAEGRYVEGPGSGRDDKIPALLSDGEYVIDAETLALLGDGSTKEGARKMDAFRANIRKHKGRALSRGRISPDAKSPNKYMGGGLT